MDATIEAPAKTEASSTVIPAAINRVSAYTNKNGNPTVSVLVGYTQNGMPVETVIHMSLNGGAKRITEETLKWNGVTRDHFKPDVNPGLPCRIRLWSDGREPDLIGAPRESDAQVVSTLDL